MKCVADPNPPTAPASDPAYPTNPIYRELVDQYEREQRP